MQQQQRVEAPPAKGRPNNKGEVVENESEPVLCLSISDVSGTDESVEQPIDYQQIPPQRYLATSPVVMMPDAAKDSRRGAKGSISSCAEMIDDYYEDEDFEDLEIDNEEDDSFESVSVQFKNDGVGGATIQQVMILPQDRSFAPSMLSIHSIPEAAIEEFKQPRQLTKLTSKKPHSLQQRVFRVADDDEYNDHVINGFEEDNRIESTIEEEAVCYQNNDALVENRAQTASLSHVKHSTSNQSIPSDLQAPSCKIDASLGDDASLTIERSTIIASIKNHRLDQDEVDYCPSRGEQQKAAASLQLKNKREVSIRGKPFHQSASKDSLARSSYHAEPRNTLANNLKTSGYKPTKHAGTASGSFGLVVSDPRFDASACKKEDGEGIVQQDQYSSHKILMSSRHAIGTDSSAFKEQQNNINNTQPSASKNTGTSQPSGNRRATQLKQRKLKGLAKAVQNSKGGTGLSSSNQESSEYTTQLQIYSSTSKNTSGTNAVSSSLQQLFSGSANASQNKRGVSTSLNSNSQVPPVSQKQSKSKARMIRNILQTSNLNTNEKKASNVTSIQTSELGGSRMPNSIAITPHVLYEPLMGVQLGTTGRSLYAIDEAFSDLFTGMLEEFGAAGPVAQRSAQELHSTQRAELDLKKAQVKQRYATLRQNLREIHSKFENQKINEVNRIESRLASLNLTLKALLKRAQIEFEHVRSREHTRIWRNCNKLTTSWITSLLVEAEKSRLFALFKTKRSFSSIIFTAQEFSQPQHVGSKSQRNNTETNQPPQSLQITREMFSEFQAQEVLKFFSRLSSPLQFLMDLRAKPFQVLKGQYLGASGGTSTEAITAEHLATQKKQSFPQAVLEFARQQVGLAEPSWEAYPVCVISPSTQQRTTNKTATGKPNSCILVLNGKSARVPTPFSALQGTHDLLKGQDGYRQAKITHCSQRRQDSLVSNTVLDVLHADCKRLTTNRFVYVCLKEAQAKEVELPKHAQMLNRISSNKAMGRMYEGATPMAQCLDKATVEGGGVARTFKVKTIKGLSQLKVEFDHRGHKAGKLFGVLAEIDLSILKQTKEFVEFFLPAQSHALIHDKQGDSQGVSLYVLEQAQQQVRQLEPFEVLFLLQSHIRLTKPVKLLDFVLNVNEMAHWNDHCKASATMTGNVPQPATSGGSFKQQKPSKMTEGRNSITFGSIHHENDQDEPKGDHNFLQASQTATGSATDAFSNESGMPHESHYLTIDERTTASASGETADKLVRRFIVRVVRQGRDSDIDKPSMLAARSSNQDGSLCVWPNCLQMTDERQTLATVQAMMMQLAVYQQQLMSSSISTTQPQGQQSQQPLLQQPSLPISSVTSRKNRPDSAYRQKQNASGANNQTVAGMSQQSGIGMPGLATIEKVSTKRVHKLRMALELEMTENIYSRFIKKGKALKEKSQSTAAGVHAQSKVRANWVSPPMTLPSSSQARTIADASNLVPILTTIIQGNNMIAQGANGSVSGLNLGPLFAKLCPFHQRVERHLAHRFNIQFQVAGPQNPNSFLKGLRVFDSWRSEAKAALINDLFVTKAMPQGSSTLTQAVMSDTIQRIFTFACSQVSNFNGPDIVNLIQILQQIPRSINYPDKFFAWIERFARQMSPFMVKNVQFNDAVAHFQFQLAPLCANLKQVKLNEDFISIELKKWINNTTGLQKVMTSQQRAYLRNNFSQLMKILTVTDVIHRFTFFQQFINKMTTQGPAGGQADQRTSTPQTKTNNPNSAGIKLSASQHAAATKGILTQKANLMPYAMAHGAGKVFGPVRVIPPEGILFQSTVHECIQRAQSQQSAVHQHQMAGGSFQPQVVVPLSVLGGGNNEQSPAASVSLSHPLSHQSISGVRAQQQQSSNIIGISSGTMSLEKAGSSIIQTKGKLTSSSIVEQRGSLVIANTPLPQQQVIQQKGASSASLNTTLLPNAAQATNVVQVAAPPASSLDKITAIYGGHSRKPMKDQSATQPYQAAQVPTPMSQSFMMASDGFLSHKKTSMNAMPSANLDQFSQLRPTGTHGVGEGTMSGQDYFEAAGSQHQRDFFSVDLKDSNRAKPRAGMPPKTQNLFTESNVIRQHQHNQLQPHGISIQQFQPRQMVQQTQISGDASDFQLPLANLTQNHGFTAQKTNQITTIQEGNGGALEQPGPSTRPNTCHNVQSNLKQQALTGGNSRGKQRSTRTQQNGQTTLLQQKQMANHASAEQVTILSKSPKKRVLTKNGALSQAIACSYSTHDAIIETPNFNGPRGYVNFLPAQYAIGQQRSRDNQGCLDKPSYQSVGPADGHHVGVSQELANFSSAIVTSEDAAGSLLVQQRSFARRQGSQSKKKSFGKQQNLSSNNHNNTIGTNQGGHSATKLGNNKPQRRQRATSAKKEIMANYASGPGGAVVTQPSQQTLPLSSNQHWSMQPVSFGQALAQEQHTAHMSNNFLKEPAQPGRFSMISGPHQQQVGMNQSMEPLVPQRYASNQAARSQMDWFLKKNKGAVAAQQSNLSQPSDNNNKKKDAGIAVSKYATEKQNQVPRVPPQMADRRINYSSGIRIINSVLTPSNAPRSAVTAKPQQRNDEIAPISNPNYQQPVIRNITSAGYPHSAKQSVNMIEVQQILPQPTSSNPAEMQRTKMLFTNSTSVHAESLMQQQHQGSKVVTQQLMNMQMQQQKQKPTAADKKQHLQVTYANAMPRLASANAYLTKQSRRLRPANLAINKGLTSSNLHGNRANNALKRPSKEQVTGLAGCDQLSRSKSKLLSSQNNNN